MAQLHHRFPDTSWTLLERARDSDDAGVEARKDFAERYYQPIFQFLRVIVGDVDTAQELTQEFFTRLSAEGKLFHHAQREQGVFRAYLMRALRNLAIDQYRRAATRGMRDVHPDQWSDGGWDTFESPALTSAEAAFHRAWVKTILGDALAHVREICVDRGQQMHLELFEARYLAPTDTPPGWEQLGAKHGLAQKAARERADTAARHFRIVLRKMLRQQVTVPGAVGRREAAAIEAAVDREIEALLGPL